MILSKKILILFTVLLVTLTYGNVNAKASVQEVAYLQTDRTTYVAGESIYYKLYVLDSLTKKCSDIIKVEGRYKLSIIEKPIPTLTYNFSF